MLYNIHIICPSSPTTTEYLRYFFKGKNRVLGRDFNETFIGCNINGNYWRSMHSTVIWVSFVIFYISKLSNPTKFKWPKTHRHTNPLRVPSISTWHASINVNCALHNIIAFRHLDQIVH